MGRMLEALRKIEGTSALGIRGGIYPAIGIVVESVAASGLEDGDAGGGRLGQQGLGATSRVDTDHAPTICDHEVAVVL